MKHITCIICPLGCRVSVELIDGEYHFSGNRCKKGADFAKAELSAPIRMLTTTVRTIFNDMPVLPVRTSGEVPKEKIPEIIKELAKMVITKRVTIGETIAGNVSGTGCSIVATCGMNIEKTRGE